MVDDALAQHAAGERTPWIIRDAAHRRSDRHHVLLRLQRAVRDDRDRTHAGRPVTLAHGGQHRGEAAAPDAGVRDARARPDRMAHRHPQRALAGRDRTARRDPGRRAAAAQAAGRRHLARHRAVRDDDRRVARGAKPLGHTAGGRSDWCPCWASLTSGRTSSAPLLIVLLPGPELDVRAVHGGPARRAHRLSGGVRRLHRRRRHHDAVGRRRRVAAAGRAGAVRHREVRRRRLPLLHRVRAAPGRVEAAHG